MDGARDLIHCRVESGKHSILMLRLRNLSLEKNRVPYDLNAGQRKVKRPDGKHESAPVPGQACVRARCMRSANGCEAPMRDATKRSGTRIAGTHEAQGRHAVFHS
jgi:hypothetical protein